MVKLSKLPISTAILSLRIATEESEIQLLRIVLNAERYLKSGRAVGHTLWQGIYETNSEALSLCSLRWGIERVFGHSKKKVF